VAGLFFGGMMLEMSLISILIYLDETMIFPKYFVVFSLLPIGSSLAFLIDTLLLPKWEYLLTYRPWAWEPKRPRFWKNVILEWAAFLSMVLWIGSLALKSIYI
jgi:hypothetical protein